MDDRHNRLRQAMADEDLDAILLAGPDNFTYLTGASLPFAPSFPGRRALAILPRNGQARNVSPAEWAGALSAQGWPGGLSAYPAGKPYTGLITAAAQALEEMGLAGVRVGFDAARMPASVLQGLAAAVPGVHWQPCDGLLRALRLVKSPAEVDLLEQASRQAERALVAALHHVEGTADAVGYTLAEAAERVRVHVGEYGGAATGHLGAVQGPDARYYHVPPRGKVREGELLRLEVTSQYRGYWASAARTVAVGPPSDAQRLAYAHNLRLKAVAVEHLRPGVACREVFASVQEAAGREGIPFLEEAGLGHGLGTSAREAPYLADYDGTELQPGMVLALDVVTYGPAGERVRSVDTYAIEGEGCRLLSWYRNWDRLYALTGSTARHG